MFNVLLTSVGRRSYLVKYFQDALNGCGFVHAANSTSQNPAFRIADKYTVTPLIYSNDYIPFLLDYCQKNEIKLIVPLFDADLPILALNANLFAEVGVFVLVSDMEVVNCCNDKWETASFLTKNGIAHPKTFIELDSALTALTSGDLMFPVIIKPRRGMGSLGIFEAGCVEELSILYRKAENIVLSSYIQYEAKQDKSHIIIQQKINGAEYHLDVINDLNGAYQNTIVKKKLAMRSGETDCAQIITNSDLHDMGRKLSMLLKHKGNLDVDVLQDSGTSLVLEMNARFGGGYPFSHVAGVDLPKAIIRWLQGLAVDKNELLTAIPGTIAHKDIEIVPISF